MMIAAEMVFLGIISKSEKLDTVNKVMRIHSQNLHSFFQDRLSPQIQSLLYVSLGTPEIEIQRTESQL